MNRETRRPRRPRRRIVSLLAATLVVAGFYHALKPLPAGLSFEGPVRQVPAEAVTFLADETWLDSNGVRRTEHRIFDETLHLVNGAQRYLLADFFLFNAYLGAGAPTNLVPGDTPPGLRPLSRELTEALVRVRQTRPGLPVVLITDPINTVYGGARSDHLESLRAAGVTVILTHLRRLRDSNPAWSAPWRVFLQWFGNRDAGGAFANPFDRRGPAVPLRSWLALFNFKANHRKLLVADASSGAGDRLVTLVTSANPHDGSSAHGNVALRVDEALWRDAVDAEHAVAALAGVSFPRPDPPGAPDHGGPVSVQLLTEGRIRARAVEMIDGAGAGDRIDLVMFYLAERRVVDALARAAQRGTEVRLVLDPNKDAFGREKNGVPNRPVARELRARTGGRIAIRWADTHGEQCHSKLLLVTRPRACQMLLGSANFTRRNIADLNLEADVYAAADSAFPAFTDARAHVERLWTNPGGRRYTADYETYADRSLHKPALYRIMEATGLSSF
jgi:hypothetical protein